MSRLHVRVFANHPHAGSRSGRLRRNIPRPRERRGRTERASKRATVRCPFGLLAPPLAPPLRSGADDEVRPVARNLDVDVGLLPGAGPYQHPVAPTRHTVEPEPPVMAGGRPASHVGPGAPRPRPGLAARPPT